MCPYPSAEATALEFRAGHQSGRYSIRDGIAEYLDRLTEIDAKLGALIERYDADALARAEASDLRLRDGAEPRALEGIPFTIKANLCAKLGTTTAGSRILDGFRAPYDATPVARAIAAGAILVGRTRQDEFGMGSSSENSPGPSPRNPWQLDYVPGGSSGGAAALAGAHGWAFHLGSDTGGSIRQPAAYCGATGMKPSYGAVSRYGLLAFASSLDQVGPLARDAADLRAVFQSIAGPDARDSTTETSPIDFAWADRPKKLGMPREYFDAAIRDDVRATVEQGIERLRGDGFEVVFVDLPLTEYANACYQVISTAEAAANLSRYDGVRYGHRTERATDLESLYGRSRAEGFGPEVQRRILLGTFVLSAGYAEAYYRRALKVRRRIRDEFAGVFKRVDALVCPTSPIPAFRIGERVADPLELYACDVLTVSANLARVPAISIPCGYSRDELPVGLQIIADVGRDATVLAIAERFQQLTDFHRQLPTIGGAS